MVATNDSACRYWMFLKSEVGIKGLLEGGRVDNIGYSFRFSTTGTINLGIFNKILGIYLFLI